MYFETMQPTRLFFHCAIPSMVSMAVSSLYTVADGIFVGRFIGQDALAAVNLVMPLVMICFALADMVAVGSSVQISILLGRREEDQARVIFSSCVKLIAAFSCLAGLLGFFLARPALLTMGAGENVTELAAQYIRVYAVFSPLVMVFFAIDNYLRVCGKARYSMVLNVVTALGNILLDFVFIVLLRWGIWSAALASCLSLSLGTVLAMVPFFRKKLKLYFVRGILSLRQLGHLLANGSSELFTNIASSAMMLILNAVLLRIGGSLAVAAVSVVMYVDSIVNSLIFGLADSMQPAISYCHGCGLRMRVRALEKRVLLTAAAISLAALIFMRSCGGGLIALFVQKGDSALLTMSLRAMELFSLSYVVSWVDACLGSYLTALDRPGRSLAVTLCGTLVFPVLSLGILAPLWGLDGVWCMPLAAGVASAVVSVAAVATMGQTGGTSESAGPQE